MSFIVTFSYTVLINLLTSLSALCSRFPFGGSLPSANTPLCVNVTHIHLFTFSVKMSS